MNDRVHAYQTLGALIDDAGPAKLATAETALLRETADALIFADADAGELLAAAEGMIANLVESGRFLERRAAALRAALHGCGMANAA